MNIEEYLNLAKIAGDIPENGIITPISICKAKNCLDKMIEFALSLGLNTVRSSELKAVMFLCEGVKEKYSEDKLNEILKCVLNHPLFCTSRADHIIIIFKKLSGITLKYN